MRLEQRVDRLEQRQERPLTVRTIVIEVGETKEEALQRQGPIKDTERPVFVQFVSSNDER
jgi:hypothetical protein